MKNIFTRGKDKDGSKEGGMVPDAEERQRMLRPDVVASPALGEYTLHLYLIDTCKIICDTDLNAMMEIECMGQKKQTRIWNGIGQSSKTRWDEHFFFRRQFRSREELEQESLTITLYNHRKLLANERIGTVKRYIFNLVNKINEPVLNQWCIFADPERDFGTAKGFLRFSMTFSMSTVEQQDLESMSLQTEDSGKLDLPPEINVSFHEMIVNIYRGRNIMGIESSGLSDPFVEVNLGGTSKRTRAVKQDANPTFYQTIRLRYLEPMLNDRVLVQLWDHNTIQGHVKLGSISLAIKDIKEGFYSVPKWLHFYGASAHTINSKVKEIMINQPDFSSTFVGELYMSVKTEENPKAVISVDDMSQKIRKLEHTGWQHVTFLLQLDVEYVYNLDLDLSEGSKIEVSLEWGSNHGKTRIPGQKFQNKLLVVNNGFTLKRSFDVSFSSGDEVTMNREVYKQIPDVFVYLTVNGKNVSFYRFSPIDVMTNVKGYEVGRTIKMKPDMSVSNMSIDGAGLMKVRVGMSEEPRNNDFLAFFNALKQSKGDVKQAVYSLGDKAFDKEHAEAVAVPSPITLFPKPDTQMKYQGIYIFIQLFQAKDLQVVEEDGLPDTFVDFYHFGSNVQSQIVKNSLNPSWKEMLCLKSYRVNKDVPNLVVNLFDHVQGGLTGSKNELIGWREIKLTMDDYTENENQIDYPDPKWYPLKVVGDVKAGQILMSVKWCMQSAIRNRQDLVNAKSREIRYSTSNYHGKIHLLALRDLKPRSMFMPTNTQVVIDTTALWKQPGDETNSLVTLPSDGVGVNPMYRRTEYIYGALPEELYLIPSIPGFVNDKAFSFFNNQQIGTFTMDLSVFAYTSKMRLIAKLEALRDHRESKLKTDPDSPDNRRVLAAINGILNHLSVDLGKQGKYIEDKLPEVFVQVNVLKEDLKKEVNQRLIATSIGMLGSQFGLTAPQESPAKAALLASGGAGLNETGKTELGLVLSPEKGLGETMGDEKKAMEVVTENMKAGVPKPALARDRIVEPNFKGAGQANLPMAIPGFGGTVASQVPESDFKRGMFELFQKNQAQAEMIVLTHQEWTTLKLTPEERRKYVELGYKNSKVNTLHYRLKVQDDLEDTSYMGVDRFSSIPIFRGRTFLRTGPGFFDYLESKVSEHRIQTGVVRARVDLIQEEVFNELSRIPLNPSERYAIEIPADLAEWRRGNFDQHEVVRNEVTVYVYILEANFAVNMDTFSKNDGYIKIQLDNRTFKGSRVIPDNNQPRFMERFEITCNIQDSSLLEIQFWDEDTFSDDLIGSTKIELLRRYNDKRMRARDDHPIEVRVLSDSSGNQTGIVSMWIDFLEKNPAGKIVNLAGNPAVPYVIEPRPPTSLYLRGVVWDLHNMPITDISGAADYLVEISIPAFNISQKTDIHLRSTDGDASFNWRFEFHLNIDFNFQDYNARVDFRVFDKELLTADKSLAHLEIDFADMIEKALTTDEDQRLLGPLIDNEKENGERFMKEMELSKGLRGTNKGRSKIELSLEVLTQQGKDTKPAGLGRSSPNDFPFLPPPEGRMQWSWNPIKMLNQLFGKNCKRYCCLIIFAIIFIIVAGFFAPILVSMILARLIVPNT